MLTLMGDNEGMTAADFGPFYESFTFFTAKENVDLLGSDAFVARLTEMGEFLLSHKALNASPDIPGLPDPSLVRKL